MENDDTIVLSDTTEDCEIVQDHSCNRDDVVIIYESRPSRRQPIDLIDLTDEREHISYVSSRTRRLHSVSSSIQSESDDVESHITWNDERLSKRRLTDSRRRRPSSDIEQSPTLSSQSEVDFVRSSIRGRCPVCLEDYGSFIYQDIYNGGLYVIECGHLFCKSCVYTLFKNKQSIKCPMCRVLAKRSSIKRILF